jgi:hypothetical protein
MICALNALQVTSVGLEKLVGNLLMLTFFVVFYRFHVMLIVWSFVYRKYFPWVQVCE